MVTPERVLRAIEKRDGGRACAWPEPHPCDPETAVPQHRAGGMGGGKAKHRLSNVIWLCSAMNGDIESDPILAREARERGIKISKFKNPTLVPIEHAVHGLVRLNDDGGYTAVES